MSVNYELLRRLYPEWYPQYPIHPILQIFLAIAIMLLIPYLYTKLQDSKFMEDKLAALWKKIRPPRPHQNRF